MRQCNFDTPATETAVTLLILDGAVKVITDVETHSSAAVGGTKRWKAAASAGDPNPASSKVYGGVLAGAHAGGIAKTSVAPLGFTVNL